MSLIVVIGRGHSGTRAISQTLSASGVFMGEPLNESGDLLPPEPMYEAASLFGPNVRHNGHLEWDFAPAIRRETPARFESLVRQYLTSVLEHDGGHKGWKLPETTLALPWIARMFPEAKYVYWVRDPRDCILKGHVTDDLARFGVDYPPTNEEYRRRAISWKYQYELIEATPRPKHWIHVRFEDFVLDQEATLERLSEFLGLPLAKVPVRSEAVGRYRREPKLPRFGFLMPLMQRYGYDISDHVFANEVS